MEWVYNDGGREAAGFRGDAQDCACRAIAIVAQLPYREVYERINEIARTIERRSRKVRSSARTGVQRKIVDNFMASLDWNWTPTIRIGRGCAVHLRSEDLPAGRIVCLCSHHFVAVIDGIVHDTSDPSRDGTRCVYGYYQKVGR